MNIKIHDNRSFGRKPVVGVHSMKSMIKFRCEPPSIDEALESPIGKSRETAPQNVPTS